VRNCPLHRFIALSLLLIGASTGLGQSGKAGSSGHRATLLLASDVACAVKIDGDKVADLVPDEPKKVAVSLGEHLVSASTQASQWIRLVLHQASIA
jgi:hypothetical protein